MEQSCDKWFTQVEWCVCVCVGRGGMFRESPFVFVGKVRQEVITAVCVCVFNERETEPGRFSSVIWLRWLLKERGRLLTSSRLKRKGLAVKECARSPVFNYLLLFSRSLCIPVVPAWTYCDMAAVSSSYLFKMHAFFFFVFPLLISNLDVKR